MFAPGRYSARPAPGRPAARCVAVRAPLCSCSPNLPATFPCPARCSFEDLSCEMIFGQAPTPIEEDKVYNQPCFTRQVRNDTAPPLPCLCERQVAPGWRLAGRLRLLHNKRCRSRDKQPSATLAAGGASSLPHPQLLPAAAAPAPSLLAVQPGHGERAAQPEPALPQD